MKKKILGLLLAVSVASSLVACGSNSSEKNNNVNVENSQEVASNVSVKEVMAKILEKQAIPMPIEADDELATSVYHLNLDNVEEYAIAQTGRSPGVGLVVLVEAKDGQVDSVKTSVEAILADKVSQAFYPDEVETMKAAEIKVTGNIVSLVVVNDEVKEDVSAILDENLK